MFPEQKSKPSNLTLPKLILAAVILICFSTVLGVAGYLAKNKAVVNLQPQIAASSQPTFSPIIKDETSDWQICKNEKYGYEIKYPLGWKVWLPGAPEARLANCEENLSLIAFSPNIYAFPNQQQINIDIYNQDRSKGTEWEGITSLDDYLKIVSVEINKETIIDGKRFVWSGVDNNQLTAFYNGSIYYFNVYNIEDSLLDQVLSTFKFTEVVEAEKFCNEKNNEYVSERSFFLNFDKDADKEIAGICSTKGEYDKEGELFVLDKQNNEYKAVLEQEGQIQHQRYYDFQNLAIKDIDNDGIDEIIYEGTGWALPGGDSWLKLYSPKYKEWFIKTKSWELDASDPTGDKRTEKTNFSPNLENKEYQMFKDFLTKQPFTL